MRFLVRVLGVVASGSLSACATIVSGTSQPVMVNSSPAGATCRVSQAGMPVGEVVATPGMVQVGKGSGALQISCNKPGYAVAEQAEPATTNGWVFGNILFGGIIGVVVDFSNGAAYEYNRNMMVNFGEKIATPPLASNTPNNS